MPNPFPFRSRVPTPLFGRRSARALSAVEELLAQAESVREVGEEQLLAACREHGVDLARQARVGRRRIYAAYLEHCLEDCELSETEEADLGHLRRILRLDPSDVDAIHEEVGRAVYGRALADVLADLEIDAAERHFLQRLRQGIGLSERAAGQLEERGERSAREHALSEAAVPDPLFSGPRVRAGDFTGRSEKGLEDAIADGLAKAALVIPRLHWFEVERIAGYVGDGGVRSWHVTLSAGLDPRELAKP